MYSSFLHACIEQLILLYLHNNSQIVTVDFEGHLDIPVIRMTTNSPFITKIWNPDVYIIDSEIVELEEVLKKLKLETVFNPRAKFIIITDRVDADLFHILYRFFITRVVALGSTHKTAKNIFSYQPFVHEDLNNIAKEPIQVANCSAMGSENTATLNGWTNTSSLIYRSLPTTPEKPIQAKIDIVGSQADKSLFGLHIPKTWNNSSIRLYESEIQGLRTTTSRTADSWTLYIVCKKLGINIEFLGFDADILDSIATSGGTKDMSDIKGADMYFGGILDNSEVGLIFDVTIPIDEIPLIWMVQRAKLLEPFKRIVTIFPPSIWKCLLVTLIIFISISYFFIKSYVPNTPNRNFELGEAIQMTLSIFAPVANFESFPMKHLYGIWMMAILIITSIFTSKLLDIYLSNIYEHQISTPEEIKSSNLVICVYHGMRSSLEIEGVKNKIVYTSDTSNCAEEMAAKGSIAVIRPLNQLSYTESFYHPDENGAPKIHILKDSFFNVHVVYVLVKGHPIFERYNDVLRKLSDSGLSQYIAKQYELELPHLSNDIGTRRLTLKHLQFAFLVWGCGIVISIVVLCLEFIDCNSL